MESRLHARQRCLFLQNRSPGKDDRRRGAYAGLGASVVPGVDLGCSKLYRIPGRGVQAMKVRCRRQEKKRHERANVRAVRPTWQPYQIACRSLAKARLLGLVQLEDPNGTALFEVVHALGDVAAPQRNSTAPASRHGDHLLAILFPGNRRSNDTGTDVEGPEFLTGLGVNTLQEAFRGAVEHQATSGGQDTTPQRSVVLVFPDDLAGGRIDSAHGADVVIVQSLDGEAGAQVSSTLLVGNRLIPDVHAPFVGRDVEQVGLRAVSHLHLVLATEEGRSSEDCCTLLAISGSSRITRVVFHVVDRAAGVQIKALGPGNLLDEREGVQQLAVGTVIDEEETVTVGLAASLDDLAGLRILEVEGNEFVNTVKVPTVVRGTLEVPNDLAGVGVDSDGGAGEQVVARTVVAVPRSRVAGTCEDQVGFRIVGSAVPGGSAASLPQVTLTSGVGGAGNAVVGLVASGVELVAHVTFNGRTGPQQLAGQRVAGVDAADDTELTTGNAGDQLAIGDDRSGGGRVAGSVVFQLFLPDNLAGVLVESDQLSVPDLLGGGQKNVF